MTLFKSYTFTWQEIGVFKLALLALGTAIGAYWHEFFLANMTAVIAIAVATLLYTGYVALKQ